MLSIGGPLTLIKASLASLPLYYMSIFPIPAGVIANIIMIQQNFLWCGYDGKRGFPLIAWDWIEPAKSQGGLGIGNLKHRNIALLFKWLWRFFQEPNSLWRRVVTEKSGYHNILIFSDISIPRNGVPWRNICNTILQHPVAKSFTKKLVRKRVGNGSSMLFWHETWLEDFPLKYRFPQLFTIAIAPSATIASMGIWDGMDWQWTFSWRRVLRPRDEEEKKELLKLLSN